MSPCRPMISFLVLILFAAYGTSSGAGEPARGPAEWIAHFSENWSEEAWTNKSRKRPGGYMRATGDNAWQVRMLALQGLVRAGKTAVPELLKTLKEGDEPQRILAAQALGYLAPGVSRETLLQAAREDKQNAVRLYAVDALGMQGAAARQVDWEALRKTQKNRDVLKHIQYALERKDEPVDPAVVKTLTDWNSGTINSAEVGKPAPDFELTSATGEQVRLSDYRGKKAVVLVFIYGDT